MGMSADYAAAGSDATDHTYSLWARDPEDEVLPLMREAVSGPCRTPRLATLPTGAIVSRDGVRPTTLILARGFPSAQLVPDRPVYTLVEDCPPQVGDKEN